MFRLSRLLAILACVPALVATDAVTIRPGEPWPDEHGVSINAHGGGILHHEGMFYWFGEHKIAGRLGNTAQVGVHVYASQDLGHWIDRGIALPVSDDAQSEIVRGCIIERPKVIYNAKTGTFAMWFHLEIRGQGYHSARTALAISRTPTGPYRYVRSFRPNAGIWPRNATEEDRAPVQSAGSDRPSSPGQFLRRDLPGGQMSRDLGLFVDEDRAAYLIAAAEENQTLHLSRLTDDYQDFSGTWARILPGGSNEAPALFKRQGVYYLITSGCTGWNFNAARSARATSIWGPWESLGNPCRGTDEEMRTTFRSQGTAVLPMPGMADGFLFLADRWEPGNPIDGRYVWLPIQWEAGRPLLRWQPAWDLRVSPVP